MKFESAVSRHGMPVYVYPMPQATTVAAGILVFAGTRDEDWPVQAGLAHACEHMLFQGNSRKKTSRATSEEIERDGGALNAHTSREITFFHREVPAYALDTALRSLVYQVAAPLFRPKDITKEMLNVVEEIKRAQDNSSGLCYRLIRSLVFRGHPLEYDTLGTEESVRSFTSEHFRAWEKRLYHPGNYVFIAVGNTTAAKVIKILDRLPLGESAGKRNCRPVSLLNQVCGERTIIGKDIKQANVVAAATFSTRARLSDKYVPALELYEAMIGGGMSFPLFQEVRDKRGLCYSVSADTSLYGDYGFFSVYVGTDKEKITQAVSCIMDVIWNHRSDERLFARTKRLLLGSISMGYTDPGGILMQAAHDTSLSGKPKSAEELTEEVKNVTLGDVTGAVELYLAPEKFSYALVVPKDTKVEI